MGTNQYESLLQECRDLFRDHLVEAVRRTFDGMDESLTALADASKDEEARSRYLAARDMALRHREVIEAQFRRRLMSEFQGRVDKSQQGARLQSFSMEDLQLVGEDEMNETLSFNDMATKVRTHCDEEMNALDQRAAVLLGKSAVMPEDNPFGAKVVADAFKHACQQVDCPLDVRLVFMKSFEKLALDGIRGTCREVNDLLVANAILPKIRYGVTKNESKAKPKSDAPSAANEEPAAAASSPAPAQDDMFSMLAQMLGGQGAQAAAMPGMGVGGLPLMQGQQLMGSLTSLQRGDTTSFGEAAAELAPILAQAGDLTNVLRQLKETSVGKGMGTMDAMTLEIVSMLFDALFEDPKVPEALKGEIGRLQLPMLKVAIADKDLFSSKDHPARRLLDTFGQLGFRLPKDFGAAHPLFAEVDAFVHEVIESFEDNTEVFDVVRGKLEALIAAEDARTAAAMQPSEKQLEQLEGLAVAKSEVGQELRARLAARPQAPRPVVEFLGEQWIKYLVMTRAREGRESPALRYAWTITDQLLWSVEPKASLEERKRLTTIIPGLLKSLKAGVTAAGIGEEAARDFLSKLMACHTEALKHHGPAPAPVKSKREAASVTALAPKLAASKAAEVKQPSPDEVIDLGKPLVMLNPFGGGEVQVSDDDLDFTAMPEPAPAPARAPVPQSPAVPVSLLAEPAPRAARPVKPSTQVRLPGAMKVGAWVSVMGDDGEERSARLHYVSPLKSHFLFVDRQGEKVYECSRTMLARRISLGEVLLLEKEPDESLFDRIMDGIFGKLKAPLAHAA